VPSAQVTVSLPLAGMATSRQPAANATRTVLLRVVRMRVPPVRVRLWRANSLDGWVALVGSACQRGRPPAGLAILLPAEWVAPALLLETLWRRDDYGEDEDLRRAARRRLLGRRCSRRKRRRPRQHRPGRPHDGAGGPGGAGPDVEPRRAARPARPAPPPARSRDEGRQRRRPGPQRLPPVLGDARRADHRRAASPRRRSRPRR